MTRLTGRLGFRHGALGILFFGVSGCGLVLGTDDLSFDGPSGAETSASGTQGSGASGAGPTTGGAPTTGNGGSGGAGQGGGAVALAGPGLLARYHLDEAASGNMPVAAFDAAPTPLNLGMRYDAIVSWAEIDGNRGLDFSTEGVGGDAFAPIGPTNKLWVLHGATRATVEVVIDVAEVGALGSAIVYLGASLTGSGHFGLFLPDATHVAVVTGVGAGGTFDVPITTLGRVVLHGVLDAAQITLYVDGVPATPLVTAATPVDLGASTHILVGNTREYANSVRGRIYYAALYNDAFSADQVTHNAQLLQAADDTPQ